MTKIETEKKREPKLDYTKAELKELGWSTISSRVNEFAQIGWLKGKKKVYQEIRKVYGRNAASVYRGFIVYTEIGMCAYYRDPKFL